MLELTQLAPQNAEELAEFIRSRHPESPSLEYKEQLHLDSRHHRHEILKDLTAMGNAGGGILLFGVEEDPANPGLPRDIKPLHDTSLPARLEDVVRDGVRPPLVFRSTRIPFPSGYVLIIEVFRSPLGPYMVQGYDDHRYYIRQGSAAAPMNEQQVREAYAFSLRTQLARDDAWRIHSLPIKLPRSEPYLAASAVPLGPPRELISPHPFDPQDFCPPPNLHQLARRGEYLAASLNPRPWAHGVYGQSPESAQDPAELFLLYREGALGIATTLPKLLLSEDYLASMAAAQLAYVDWLWKKLGLNDLVEVEIRLHNAHAANLPSPNPFTRHNTIAQPPGSPPIEAVSHRVVLCSTDLRNARCRHRLVWEFANKICHAYGRPQASSWRFTEGVLYGRDGQPTGLVVVGGGIQKIGRLGDPVAKIYENGRVERTPDSSYVGHFSEGCFSTNTVTPSPPQNLQ